MTLARLPGWCYESIVEESGRSGRSPASLVVWALAWSIAMALGITLVSAFDILVGLSGVFVIVGFLTPIAVGTIVGWRTPGLGGFGVGFVGLATGGLLVGILLSAVAILGGAFADASTQQPPGEALLAIPLMILLVPTLLGAQFGIGLLVGTVVGRRRRRSPVRGT